MRKSHIYPLSDLSGGLDILKTIGGGGNGKPLPVKVTVDITTKVANTLLGFGSLFAGAIIVTALVRASRK